MCLAFFFFFCCFWKAARYVMYRSRLPRANGQGRLKKNGLASSIDSLSSFSFLKSIFLFFFVLALPLSRISHLLYYNPNKMQYRLELEESRGGEPNNACLSFGRAICQLTTRMMVVLWSGKIATLILKKKNRVWFVWFLLFSLFCPLSSVVFFAGFSLTFSNAPSLLKGVQNHYD